MSTALNERGQIAALKEERAGLYEEMRALTLAAESESRDLTAEEAQEFDRMEKAAGDLETRAGRLERIANISGLQPVGERQVRDDDQSEWQEVSEDERREARSEELRARRVVNIDEIRTAIFNGERRSPLSFREFNELRSPVRPQDTPEYRWSWCRYMTVKDMRDLAPEELRVLSKATAGAGLNLVPTEFQRTLIDALREVGIMRQISRVISTDAGEALQIPSVTSHGTAAWTAENAAFTASDDAFGQATLNAYKAATLIKVSEELLQDSAFDLESYIRSEFGMRIGILENTAYVAGDGSGKPTGVTTQASAGITAASATAITADELIDLYHSLLAPYRRNASFVVKDSTIKIIRKLKETTNQYLWQPGLVAGAPDTLLGRPIYTDPDMPAATAGLVAALFGDFSYYWIRDVNGIAFQRLNELYAENGQVGFRAYHRTDGELLNTAAIKKITML